MKKLSVQPKNPKHLVALCFIALRQNPQLKEENFLIKKVGQIGSLALFKSYYGYFWVEGYKRQVLSKEFHTSIKEAKDYFKSAKLS